MGTVRVTVSIDGVDEVIARLTSIDTNGQENLLALTKELASDTQSVWKQGTPRRSGRLQDDERALVEGLSFTLNNSVYYYKFVDEGHWTPRGWRTKRGYRAAKRRSFVKGQELTAKPVEFVRANINSYLSRFLENA